MGYRLDEVLMFFAIYSIAGWLINMSIYYLIEGKFDKRSICRGPYSASFGTGALLLLICNIAAPKFLSAIFGVGVAVGLLIQALASVIIRLFSGKWIILHKWYLIPLFGVANVLMFYQVQPFVSAVVSAMPPWIRMTLLLVFWMSFVPDIIDGFARMTEYRKKYANKIKVS